uniref:cGAS/DncV-like nucleotidyltransferase C-terminal helical domain-containing protein n=1 Tax=Candidatus Kentrum sp. FW TaxID=2126338 RepID=A0A450U409_9GAMM|nr:MAG: hypothetical protein BECKFW1821C_GA0114237_11525 [Candidatus Kentron sp. FW]
MKDWETTFTSWAKPPGSTEQERIAHAEKGIRDAIRASDALKHRDIRVFTQGSCRNDTSVRRDSDVDIAVVCYQTLFIELPPGTTKEMFGLIDGDYSYRIFKNEVQQALFDRFGPRAVYRGNKAFDVHENTYRIEADVAPFFEHRRYNINGSYLSGVELIPDNGNPAKVINWPEQHYNNGVSKNTATTRRYKRIVRILKRLRNEMEENSYTEANSIPGFLLECLTWNVPNHHFGYATYTDNVRACLAFLFENTKIDSTCSEWREVSDLKYLFQPSQKWTRQHVNSFLLSAWRYIGFQ